MKLTIIPIDSFVAVDGNGLHQPLDISNCGIPTHVHALQWLETKGWIEFDDSQDPFSPKLPNEIIESLPEWALACVAVWESWTPPVALEPELEIPITTI
jgi:hypothetical protein